MKDLGSVFSGHIVKEFGRHFIARPDERAGIERLDRSGDRLSRSGYAYGCREKDRQPATGEIEAIGTSRAISFPALAMITSSPFFTRARSFERCVSLRERLP